MNFLPIRDVWKGQDAFCDDSWFMFLVKKSLWQLDTGWSALRTMCGGIHPTFVTGLAVCSDHIFNWEADCTREELCSLSDIFSFISHLSHLFSTPNIVNPFIDIIYHRLYISPTSNLRFLCFVDASFESKEVWAGLLLGSEMKTQPPLHVATPVRQSLALTKVAGTSI